jgi:hypothetical protein
MNNLAAILDGVGAGSLNLGKGRRLKRVECRIKRELDEADLALVTDQEAGIKPEQVKHLLQSHHTIARLLAKGERPQNVSLICGIGISRISILKGDPAFAELLEYYIDMEGEANKAATVDLAQRLALLGEDSVEALHDRLRDNPDQFSNKELTSLAEVVLDRTGFGKTSTVNSNVNLGVSDETLARLRAASDAPAQLTEADRSAISGIVLRATDVYSGGETQDGLESNGSLLREEAGAELEAELPAGEVSPVDPLHGCDGPSLLRAGALHRTQSGSDPARGEADGGPAGPDADGGPLQASAGEDHW